LPPSVNRPLYGTQQIRLALYLVQRHRLSAAYERLWIAAHRIDHVKVV
jgi:hypothetical protein